MKEYINTIASTCDLFIVLILKSNQKISSNGGATYVEKYYAQTGKNVDIHTLNLMGNCVCKQSNN